MHRYQAIAEYYDAEYAREGMLRHDVPFMMSFLPPRSCSILELGTGTARAALPLAAAGHRVVGVDAANEMLAIAERKRVESGLTAKQLGLVRGDMRSVRLGRTFDWVCILFNTLLNAGGRDELLAVLETARVHLRPNGRFWVDIFNPDLARLAEPVSHQISPTLFFVPSLNRTVLRTVDFRRQPSGQSQKVTFKYQWFTPAGRPQSRSLSFLLTWVMPRELSLLMDSAGLQAVEMFGDYDGSPLTDASPRIIALCRLRSKPRPKRAKIA